MINEINRINELTKELIIILKNPPKLDRKTLSMLSKLRTLIDGIELKHGW